ncbi:MAG TPA: hypothetical protein VI078_16575 [bacterium]
MSGTAPEGKAAAPAAWSWRAVAGVFVLLALVLFLREPQRFLNAQLWAEDGSVFFKQAYEQGALRPLLTPASGYLHTFPRLVAGLAQLFPLETVPLVFALAAFAIQLLPVLYLLSARLHGLLPDPRLRALAAALYVLVPNSYETFANVSNSQWHLCFLALLILFAERPGAVILRVAEGALLGLAMLTGPFSILLLPCAALNAWQSKDGAEARRWRLVQAGVCVLGAAVQAFVVLSTERLTSAAAPPGGLTLREILQIVSTHVFFNTVLGIEYMFDAGWAGKAAALLAGWGGIAFLVAVAVRWRHRALLSLLYLASAVILLSLLFPLNTRTEWLKPSFGPRYYYLASLFVAYALLFVVVRGGRWRWAGMPAALALLVVGIPVDFRHYALMPDTRWRDQMAVFETLAQGESFSIPLPPYRYPAMTLRKKTPPRGDAPLHGRRELPGDVHHAFQRPVFTDPRNPSIVRFTAWAANAIGGRRIEGAWIAIDGRPYPATVGPWRAGLTRSGRDDEGPLRFEREVPLRDFGLGDHRIGLVLLTAGGAYTRLPERIFRVGAEPGRLILGVPE